MSSFKRRVQPTQTARSPGTKPSPSAHSVLTISTGIPSLDDVLGGGLPLGHVLVILAPDPHTAYGELLQRYFVAQGLASGQNVCILDDSAMGLAMGCMWIQSNQAQLEDADERDSTGDAESSEVKIAWRYENMKKFQTSVSSPTSSGHDSYCAPFDLTCRITEDIVNKAVASRQLRCVGVSAIKHTNTFEAAMTNVEELLSATSQPEGAVPVRISFPFLGSPQWEDMTPANILRLLHVLRARLRGSSSLMPRASALITLPSYLSGDEWGGPGWSQKLAWLSDGCITLRAFSADPDLISIFPSHHGLIDIHKLPSPQTLVPASDRFSQLRGLSTFSSSSTGGGENNLAFKCTRKRFVIETLHLDVEGGVSERRTTAPVTADVGPFEPKEASASAPTVQVSIDATPDEPTLTKKKAKKSVAFRSDRPELYDF